jgi:hypothetical protein
MFPTKYEIDAKRSELMNRAEQERLAEQVKPVKHDPLRRAVELLVGLLQPTNSNPAPKRYVEYTESQPQPSKLATDSGIHRIR